MKKNIKKVINILVLTKGTILTIQGNYNEAHNLYLKELDDNTIQNNYKLTNLFLFGLFQVGHLDKFYKKK